MFSQYDAIETFKSWDLATQSKHAIILAKLLCFDTKQLSQREARIVHDWLNADSKMHADDIIASIEINTLHNICLYIKNELIAQSQKETDISELVEALGYTYQKIDGALSLLMECHNIPVSHQERIALLQQIIRPAAEEAVSSSITLLRFIEQGYLSDENVDIMGYKVLMPSYGSDMAVATSAAYQ